MRPEVKEAVRDWRLLYLQKERSIVEIGSLDVNGNFRDIFTGQDYVGVDMRAGPNVDIVLNAHRLREAFKARSLDVIICCDTFEHDDAFWLTLDEIHRALRRGGYFICSVPTIAFTTFHGHPEDYWRFTDSAFTDIIMRLDRYKTIDRRDFRTVGDVDTFAAIGKKR